MLYIMDSDKVHVNIDWWVGKVILYNMCYVWVAHDLLCTINITMVAKNTGHDSSLFIHKLKCSFHNQEKQNQGTNK